MAHWVDERQFEQADAESARAVRAAHGWQDRFVVLFAGNIGLVQGLETVLRAACQLQAGGQILIAFVGDGTDKARLQALADSLRLRDRVQFIDRQPAETMPGFMAAADALLVHLKQSELSHYVIPTKTLSYLAAGRPILMAMEGAAAQLVREAQAGMVVPPEDPGALAEAVRALCALPFAERSAIGRRGRDYLRANFARPRVIDQYAEVLRRVLALQG
jgi:glycosyltransferase involved in cell wall biosynthesis